MIPTRDLLGGKARENDSAASSSSNSASAFNGWRYPMETCRGGIDPIRLAAEILEVPYLEVLDFKTKYLSRLFDDRLQELSEEVMRPLDITITQNINNNVGELERAAYFPQRRVMPGGVAMASTAAAAAPAVEPPPDDSQAVESKIERLTRSVAALKKRTIEEMNSLKSQMDKDLASQPATDFPQRSVWPGDEIWGLSAVIAVSQSDSLPVDSARVASKEITARRSGSVTNFTRGRLHGSFGVGGGRARGDPPIQPHVAPVNVMRKRKRFLQGDNIGVLSQPSAGAVLQRGFIDPFGPITRPTLKPELIFVSDDSSEESPISFKPSQFE